MTTEGNMKDFTAADPAPWGASAADIKSIEIGEGVTKVGNCAFIDCSIDAPNTFTVDDEDFELNLLAFVSADGSATNAPATEVFRVVKSETGMAEPAVAFGPKDSTDLTRLIEDALFYFGTTPVQVLTLADVVNRDKAAFTLLAGEKPYSKAMQGLLL